MSLNNIIAPRQTVVNSKGQPVAGGFVYLYEPGTTTFITSYTGADLVTPHQNPIRLSGSGRANVWITRNCDMQITDRNGNPILTEDDANPDSLGGETGSLVPNGSFEDVTAPPVPDSWTAADEAGSTNAADSSFSTDGSNSYRFTSAGAGGGSLTTSDFFPVNAVDQLRVNFNLFSTVAAVRNIVRVEWYDVTFTPISNSDVYDSTSNPLTWMEFQLIATPPALARFAKVRLIGIDPTVLLAGSTYFDQVTAFYPTVVSGIFDNITIQDNEIISTNLNGQIELKPNGSGQVRVGEGIGASNAPLAVVGTTNADPTVPDTLEALMQWLSADFNLYGQVGMDGEDFIIRANASGGGVAIDVNHTVAGIVAGLYVSEDGVSLRGLEDDTPVLDVPAEYDGVYIMGLLNNDPDTGGLQDQQIGFYNNSIQWTGRIGFDIPGTDMLMSNFVVGGGLQLAVAQAIGVFRTAFYADPTATTDIYHTANDDLIAQSATAALGGLFVNNTLTGVGLERVLTASDTGVIPAGTITNATLRWGGAGWVEETDVRITSTGELQTNDIRSLGGVQIDVLGLTEADPGMFFRDGAGITFEDTVQSGNAVKIHNKGIGTPTVVMSNATGFSFRLLNGSFQIRNAADSAGASFSYLASTENSVIVSGPDVFDCIPALRLTQKITGTNEPIAEDTNVAIWPEDVTTDEYMNLYTRAGAFPVDDRVLAHLNPRRIANTSLDLSGNDNSERAINATFFYDDNSNYTIDLPPNTQTKILNQSTFTVLNAGTGTITVDEGTGMTLYIIEPGTGRVDTTGGLTIGAGGYATFYRDSATVWYAFGAGLTA